MKSRKLKSFKEMEKKSGWNDGMEGIEKQKSEWEERGKDIDIFFKKKKLW